MFINTLWYDNVDDYDFLKLKNVLPLKIYLGYVFFNHLKKIRWFWIFKIENCYQIRVLKTFIKFLVYIYTNGKLCLNFIFMILVTSFSFQAQITCMWLFK
jgi:hypothetical protein